MNELIAKIGRLLESVLTSILSTLLVSLGMFLITWYVFVGEFPPKVAHVKEKWGQYQEMFKLGQQALEKLHTSKDESSSGNQDTANLQQLQKLLSHFQKPSGESPSPEQWSEFKQRLSQLEAEVQILKAKQGP